VETTHGGIRARRPAMPRPGPVDPDQCHGGAGRDVVAAELRVENVLVHIIPQRSAAAARARARPGVPMDGRGAEMRAVTAA